MLTKFTKSLNQNIYLNAASDLGYEITIYEEDFGYSLIKKNGKSIEFFKNIPGIESIIPAKLSGNKYVSNKILSAFFPLYFPETKLFHSNQQNLSSAVNDYCEARRFQIVIKPNSLASGRGVTVLPKNNEEVLLAIEMINKYGVAHFIVQNYLNGGKEYRIVLMDNILVDVLERIPAYVIGNGRNSIIGLIEMKNKNRAVIGFKKIKINNALTFIVNNNGFAMDSILKHGYYLQLCKACNFGQGGEVKRIDLSKVNSDVAATCIEVAKKTNLRLVGLDYIGEDITLTRTPEFGFNEINAYPMPDIHYFADIEENKPLDFTKKLLAMMLK